METLTTLIINTLKNNHNVKFTLNIPSVLNKRIVFKFFTLCNDSNNFLIHKHIQDEIYTSTVNEKTFTTSLDSLFEQLSTHNYLKFTLKNKQDDNYHFVLTFKKT